MIDIYTLFTIFILGLAIGSFLNVVILRVPTGENIAFPASHCTSCNTPLKAYHNIPLFSWIFLGGKCAFCKEKISMQYPSIELAHAIMFSAIFYKAGVSVETTLIALSFTTLLALTMIDIKYKAIPDSLNLLALTLALASDQSFKGFFENLQNALILAGAFSLLRFYLSYYLYLKFQRFITKMKDSSWTRFYNKVPTYIEALGEGDIMVAATMGAILGLKLSLMAVFLSALLSIPVLLMLKMRNASVAFVPFLTTASLTVFFFDDFFSSFLG